MLRHKSPGFRRYSNMDEEFQEEEEVKPVADDVLKSRESKKNIFRSKILNWKKQQINETTKNSQDTTVLNKYLKDAANLYIHIRDKLEGRSEQRGGGVNIDFDLNVDSGMERADLLSSAYSDLIEFPFTYNNKLINAFPKKNSLEHAEIIPNQE